MLLSICLSILLQISDSSLESHVATGFQRVVRRLFAVFDRDRDGVLSVESELPALMGELFGIPASPDAARSYVAKVKALEDEACAMAQQDANDAAGHEVVLDETQLPQFVVEKDDAGAWPEGLLCDGLYTDLQQLMSQRPAEALRVLSRFHYTISAPFDTPVVPHGYEVMPGCRMDAELD